MSKLRIILAFFLLAAAAVHGRPLSENEMRMTVVEKARRIALLLKNVRPCNARILEVKADLLQYNEIQGDPHYIPECTKDGKFWRDAQCDHHESGSCFCVHKENGEIMQHTRDKNLHKEGLSCAKGHDGHQCLHMQDEFTHKQEEYGLQGHSPLFYYPECTAKGQFKALQRNDRTFFCVDTSNGDMIPDTETKAGTMPPLTEQICRAYDEVWNKWKTTRNLEAAEAKVDPAVTRASCKPGFTYTDCGCPIKCTHETTKETDRTCICKQACVCPDGMFDLDGKCVSLEECNEAKPPASLPQADKLRELAPRTWKEYRKQNIDAVLETYNVRGMEELEYAGGPVAYDHNPASYFVPSETPPESDFVDGEQIPGNEEPNFLNILREIGDQENEIDEKIENERLIEHQIDEGVEFSAVPKLRDEEMRDRQTPPCDDSNHEPLEEETVLSEEEAAAAEINRVLEENDIAVEATFEKPTPSIKKNTHG